MPEYRMIWAGIYIFRVRSDALSTMFYITLPETVYIILIINTGTASSGRY